MEIYLLNFSTLLLSFIAAVYFGFGLMTSGKEKLIEILFAVFIFVISFAAAYIGSKTGIWIVASGLILHGFWDMLHMDKLKIIKTKLPDWYPLFCLFVDWMIALMLIIWMML